MKCQRCSGLMGEVSILLEGEKCRSWTCMVCGEVTDRTIQENRAESLSRCEAYQANEIARRERSRAFGRRL
jgi:hypothetical protein